jgi:hypothetical protein
MASRISARSRAAQSATGLCLVLGLAWFSQTPAYLQGFPATAWIRGLLRTLGSYYGLVLLLELSLRPERSSPRFPRLASLTAAGSLAALLQTRADAGLGKALAEASSGWTWASFISDQVVSWAVLTGLGTPFVLGLVRLRERFNQEVALRREAQDAALRAKLAPHFIFNTLNTLKAQLELDPRAAGATADRLAALFRQVLERSDRATIPLREELAFVEAYLGIERARLGSRLKVTVEVAEDLEAAELPPMALQALVENAIVHGIAPREEGGEVRIQARWNGEGPFRKLQVRVENPVAPGARPGTGTGLRVLRERLLRPDDLTTGLVGGLFRAEFVWRGAAA